MTLPIPELNSFNLIPSLKRGESEHKGDAGKVLLIGGAPGMAGAIVLAGKAALHLGAGWTILEMLDPASAHVIPEQAELMVRVASEDPQNQLQLLDPDVITIGPGLGQSALARQYLEAVLSYPKKTPLVIDADAINLLAEDKNLMALLQKRNQTFPGLSVLTPHPGEAARLLASTPSQVQDKRLKSLEALVNLTQSIIVLKGHHTLLASPIHSATQCMRGNPGMAGGGMGDILTGSIAALAGQGISHHLNLWQASSLAVELHATAADILVDKQIGPIGLTPTETILEMRKILNKLL
jgi:ADP-dependent NAD(P)H-hydrate dehydratase / NAD(P)H-hydrate epimerase